ncbi:MAG: hypothetical protein LBV74_19555 [Tannerella sp.]|jgi:hypothetical protein|nr:hypothetical protein [Tannerella sp.]
MEYQKPRIEFYRQRTFSEKLNAVFEFIRENWKPLLKYSFYLIMPICLVQAFAMNSFFDIYIDMIMNSVGGNPFGNSMISFFTSYGVMLFCMLIGSTIMSGMVYAMMQTYATRENRLQDITLNDFKEALVKNVWRCLRIIFALLFVYLLIVFIMAFLAVIVSTISLVITIPLLIAFIICLVPLMMLVPVYIFEHDIDFFDAIKKAWKLGTATLGGMLGLMIVLNIIASVIQTVTMLPWYLTLIFGTIFSISSESMIAQSVIYKFAIYILGLIQSYGMYVSTIIGIIGLAFQYFHAREKVEGITIESNISNFNDL